MAKGLQAGEYQEVAVFWVWGGCRGGKKGSSRGTGGWRGIEDVMVVAVVKAGGGWGRFMRRGMVS